MITIIITTLLSLFSFTTASNNPLGQIPFQAPFTVGAYPQDFALIGPPLEAVHESQHVPTGLALDNYQYLYITYPRNAELSPNNVVICTSFTDEVPWPSASIQNCTEDQDPSTCFINVQNVVLDSIGQLWVVDSGIPFNGTGTAIPGGAKLMSFNETTAELINTYIIPDELLHDKMWANDVRINNTLGTNGYAFIADESQSGSLLTINLDTGDTARHLFNTSVVKADEKFVSVYNGEPIYSWNNHTRGYVTTGANGIALQGGNVIWSVLGSRRFYTIPQTTIIDDSLSEKELLEAVVFPSQVATETAGLSADDAGRVYITAGEHNAIFYYETLDEEGKGIRAEDYVIRTLVRNALVQHADTMAVLDGYLYFTTNQLKLSPGLQEGNVDRRRGPYRSYRVWIGAGPAV